MSSRNLEYVKENFQILYKKTLEYKVNLWSSLIVQFFFLATMIIFFTIINENFGKTIGWTHFDFILFLMIADNIWNITGIFIWNKNLSNDIINGNLNSILCRPLNSFAQFIFKDLSPMAIIMTIANLPIIIYIILNLKFQLYNIIVSTLIFITLIIFLTIFVVFLNSFSFYWVKASDITRPVFGEGRKITKNFPFQFFQQTKLKFILLFWSSAYASSLLVPILKDYPIWEIQLQLIILFGLLAFVSIGTFVNWKLGLKKYEAFN